MSATCTASRRRGSAREFNIPKIYGSWENLVEDDAIDAVVIGAWPYLHCPVTLAAIDAGKHVLTQARMAMNAREAQRMHDAALEHPELTMMVVPSPYGLAGDAYVRSLIEGGYPRHVPRGPRPRALERPGRPGDPARLAADVQVFGLQHADAGHPLRDRPALDAAGQPGLRLRLEAYRQATRSRDEHRRQGRQSRQRAGADRSRGRRERQLSAQRGRLAREPHGDRDVRQRRDLDLRPRLATRSSAVAARIPGSRRCRSPTSSAAAGRSRPTSSRRSAASGPVTHTDFATGVRYMQFTEAVARSSRHQHPVALPLQEFSNPSL